MGVASEKVNCDHSPLGTFRRPHLLCSLLSALCSLLTQKIHGYFNQKEKLQKKKFSFRHTSLQFFMWENISHMEQTANRPKKTADNQTQTK